MDLGFPILDSPGVLRAVVVAALNLSWLSRLTAENHLYPGATFTLVDGDGNVFLRYPQGRESIGQPIFAKALDDGALSQETERAVESLGSDGVQRLIAFAPLKSPVGGKPIYAAIDISAAMAFEEADQILVHDLITLGLLTALTLVAAWFGADIVVLRRIRDIVTATKQIVAGNLSARTRLPYGGSELGQMARTFDELGQALEKRKAEADATTQQLRKQQQRQKALYDLNLTITSTLDLTSVLNTFLDEISSLFSSCAASVGWINKQSGALEIIAYRNLDQTDEMPDGIAIEQGLPLVVLKRQSTLAISNALMDPRTTNPEFFRQHRLVSYLGMPLIAKGDVWAFSLLYERGTPLCRRGNEFSHRSRQSSGNRDLQFAPLRTNAESGNPTREIEQDQAPGQLTFGEGSSSARVAVEMYQQMSGTKLVHVPYKSNPPGDHRSHRRPDRRDDRRHADRAAAHTVRPADRARRHEHEAFAASARSSDDERGRHQGLRNELLVRGVPAREDACACGEAAERAYGEGGGHRTGQGVLREKRTGAVHDDAGAARDLPGG